MPEWGTTKDEDHPHPSLPRQGGGNNVAASRRLDGKRGGNNVAASRRFDGEGGGNNAAASRRLDGKRGGTKCKLIPEGGGDLSVHA